MPHATKILAVDDREENLVALAAVLDALPVELVCVGSGQEALRELLNDDFALILLDVVMPDMDGFETAGHIKSRPRTRDIPIIFLTAAGEGGEQAYQGYAAGAVDYLTKPFDPWLLRAKVSVFVDLHRRATQVRQQAAMLRQALEGEDAEDGGALLRTLDHRVGDVEKDLARLRDGDPPGVLGGPSNPLRDLEGHVADLRATLDAILR